MKAQVTPGSYPGPQGANVRVGRSVCGPTIGLVSDAGLFGPSSLIWRVNREGILLLGGGRALILQVAHPLVAAGVEQHSSFREDPWGRLSRTLDVTTRIVFGSTTEADEASARLWRVHGRVHGVSADGVGYDARDPELLLWVHATLVDTALLVYRRYVGPLSIGELRRYYEEQKLLGEKFGVPRERQPPSFAAFNEYVASMLEGDTLRVTPTLREVVDATLGLGLPRVARPLAEALNLATVGMLPPRLRDELGLAWGPGRERLLGASQRLLRALVPALPGIVRDFPPARSAERRARAA
jgi:uncharacterized protein (DUF2236 family)